MRLAFCSPLPPAPTGIADYSIDVLRLLPDDWRIDVYHDQTEVDAARLPANCAARPHGELIGAHARNGYDAVVYQMGNAMAHAYIYDVLPKAPGLLVLHDLVLHHSRARMALDSEAMRAYAAAPWNDALRDEAMTTLAPYRDDLRHAYAERADDILAAQLGTPPGLLPYAYPLFHLPVEAARLTAVHNDYMAEAIREELPRASVVRIPMPIERVAVAPVEVAALRARYQIGHDDIVIASFGLLTREKRVETVCRAVARASAHMSRLRLLLVGQIAEPQELDALIDRLGLRARVITAGRVPFAELAAHIELADIAVHLRYPSARETSAALLRVLAQGRPTIISDMEHQRDVPTDAVTRIDVSDEEGEVTRAVLRLAARSAERARLGEAAARFTAREHSPERCRAAYVEAIEQSKRLPAPPPGT